MKFLELFFFLLGRFCTTEFAKCFFVGIKVSINVIRTCDFVPNAINYVYFFAYTRRRVEHKKLCRHSIMSIIIDMCARFPCTERKDFEGRTYRWVIVFQNRKNPFTSLTLHTIPHYHSLSRPPDATIFRKYHNFFSKKIFLVLPYLLTIQSKTLTF